MKTRFKLSTLTTLIIVLLFGCNDSTQDPQPADDIVYYKGTQSPGDVWEWEINRTQKTMTASWDYGTFDNTSDDIAITGNVDIYESGFMKVTITSATATSEEIPTDGSAYFYALELPDMALVIKPEGSIKGDIITMVAQGDANNLAGDYNYVIVAPGNGESFNPTIEESIGQVNIVANGNGFDITGEAKSLDCYDGPCTYSQSIGGVPTAVVEDLGNFMIYDQENNSTVASGQYTDAGILMVDFGYGNGGVFALQQNSTTLSDLHGLNFNGIAYLPAGDEKTIPVKMQIDNSGVTSGNPYLDIENNIVDTENGVSFNINSVQDGIISGTMDHTDGSSTVFAGAVKAQGDDYIMIISSTTSEVGNPPLLLVLTSK